MRPVYCVVDPNLRDFLGHHASYDHAVAEAADRAGYDAVVLGHAAMDGTGSGLVGSAWLVPAFADDIWAQDGSTSRLGRWRDRRRRNRGFREALEQHLPKRMPHGSVILAHMVTDRQIGGLADVAAALPPGVRLVVLLRYQARFYQRPTARRAFRRFERLAARGADIRLATDSDRLSARIGRLTTLAVDTLPIPHAPADIALPDPSPDRPLTFASLGNARGEKGFAEILTVARRLAALPGTGQGLHFLLQANDPSPDVAAALRDFRAHPTANVTLLDNALDHAGYEALLAGADVVLAPYRREVYEDRTSGVALEAVATGRPLICTRGTWLSDLLERHGAGQHIPDSDVEALQAAILAVRGDWPALAAAAARGAESCRAIHNADALIHMTTGTWPETTTPMPARNVAVFYPWGDFDDPRSGASLRSNTLVDLLAEVAEEVTVVHAGSAAPAARRGNIRLEASPDRLSDKLLRRALALLALPLLWPRGRGQHLMLSLHLTRLVNPAFWLHARRVISRADHVFLEYTFWAPVIAPLCRHFRVGLTITDHDVVSSQVTQSRLLRALTLWVEKACLRQANHAVCVSEQDSQLLSSPWMTVEVIPNPVKLALADFPLPLPPARILSAYYGIDLPPGPICLFVGSRHGPNIEAAEALRDMARHLAPPDGGDRATIVVAGACMEPQRAPGFVALGKVPDLALRCLYRLARLAVIPLRQGTGTSLKTLEAMAERLPVLGTSIAFRGLGVTPGQDGILEDDLAVWPSRIQGLLDSPHGTEAIAQASRLLAERFGHRQSFAPYLVDIGVTQLARTASKAYAQDVAQCTARAQAQLMELATETGDPDLLRECSEHIRHGARDNAALVLTRI
ncbi:glycosyltransferase [Roseomonas sp. F4]